MDGIWCAGRSVLTVALTVAGTPMRFVTVHLESPTPGAPATAPRKEQLARVRIRQFVTRSVSLS